MTASDPACTFCDGLSSDGLDVVARGERAVVILDRVPINRGHMLVIPRRHAPDLLALTDEELTEMALLARRADAAVRAVLPGEVEGTNLVMSNGAAADQSVFHAHLHVIPRRSGDGFEFVEDATRYPLPPLTGAERSALSERVGA